MTGGPTPPAPGDPASVIEHLLRPFQRFAATESSGGIVLLLCTILALAWANSPWADSYHRAWEIPLTIGAGRAC